ncbi:hypothetical protein Tco_0423358, partial [Tanacetum coccineum]
ISDSRHCPTSPPENFSGELFRRDPVVSPTPLRRRTSSPLSPRTAAETTAATTAFPAAAGRSVGGGSATTAAPCGVGL